ncbi:MAG: hypothetical protein M8861_10240, partial [marine benthic group bacterium]|nr:hypothetical protein [Gemmatimonadota bacterium]
MSTVRGLRALIAVSAACLATAWPAQAQEASPAPDLTRDPGLTGDAGPAADASLLRSVPPLALRPIGSYGPIPVRPAVDPPAPAGDDVFCCDRRHFW